MNDELKNRGWVEGSAADFLGLSPVEEQLVSISFALSKALREARKEAGLTQSDLAARLGMKQPNVVRLELGTASLDLIMHALLEIRVSPREIGKIIAGAQRVESKAEGKAQKSRAVRQATGRAGAAKRDRKAVAA